VSQQREQLTDLGYADDLLLLTHAIPAMQQLLEALEREAKSVGLLVNFKPGKTEFMTFNLPEDSTLLCGEKKVVRTSEYKYLGTMSSVEKTISMRIAMAVKVNVAWTPIWKSKTLSTALKIRLFRSLVESVLMYGLQAISLTPCQEQKLCGAYTRMLRHVLDRAQDFSMTLDELYADGKIPQLSTSIRRHHLNLVGNVMLGTDQTQPLQRLILWQFPAEVCPTISSEVNGQQQQLQQQQPDGTDSAGQAATPEQPTTKKRGRTENNTKAVSTEHKPLRPAVPLYTLPASRTLARFAGKAGKDAFDDLFDLLNVDRFGKRATAKKDKAKLATWNDLVKDATESHENQVREHHRERRNKHAILDFLERLIDAPNRLESWNDAMRLAYAGARTLERLHAFACTICGLPVLELVKAARPELVALLPGVPGEICSKVYTVTISANTKAEEDRVTVAIVDGAQTVLRVACDGPTEPILCENVLRELLENCADGHIRVAKSSLPSLQFVVRAVSSQLHWRRRVALGLKLEDESQVKRAPLGKHQPRPAARKPAQTKAKKDGAKHRRAAPGVEALHREEEEARQAISKQGNQMLTALWRQRLAMALLEGNERRGRQAELLQIEFTLTSICNKIEASITAAHAAATKRVGEHPAAETEARELLMAEHEKTRNNLLGDFFGKTVRHGKRCTREGSELTKEKPDGTEKKDSQPPLTKLDPAMVAASKSLANKQQNRELGKQEKCARKKLDDEFALLLRAILSQFRTGKRERGRKRASDGPSRIDPRMPPSASPPEPPAVATAAVAIVPSSQPTEEHQDATSDSKQACTPQLPAITITTSAEQAKSETPPTPSEPAVVCPAETQRPPDPSPKPAPTAKKSRVTTKSSPPAEPETPRVTRVTEDCAAQAYAFQKAPRQGRKAKRDREFPAEKEPAKTSVTTTTKEK
jgi:hypothetical protein